MSLFSKLFGGGSGSATSEAEPETYQGFRIIPTPEKDPAGFRLAGRIEKEIDGEVKEHSFIRADTFSDREQAISVAVTKGKQLIDEKGEGLFR